MCDGEGLGFVTFHHAGGFMKSRLHLKPGQRGTKKLVERYGKALFCVRYRYDEARGVRLKTVEIVVEEKPWRPAPTLHDADLVGVPVAWSEKELREKVKALGGRWDPPAKVWLIPYGSVRGTELEKRVVVPDGVRKPRSKHPE